ncbi:cysteine-rich small domain-containing protein [uncultured Ilyobacter sp.]|uniref:cysteine-rich small domain-containing protein n=1 Tax=uncultured Ilyobacter sp. TaxID=544433 RepID=UPI0029C02CF5|nr:cysteine-rich small domain-containing protein [uncultured Ilyobacter sp.]
MFESDGFNYKFVQNSKCEYFPCHDIKDKEKFNCLFCYCPLYMMGEECGGNFKYTEHGIKDCSKCVLPHIKDVGYDHIQEKMMTVIDMVKDEYLIKNGKNGG